MKKYLLVFVFGLMASLPVSASQADTVLVKVLGTHSDARFEPAVIRIQPGDVIRFEVVEGLHTVTAYHPDNRRPRRMPENAQSFDSGLLSKGQSWWLTIDELGVYDYFCLPHERLGHAGRILAGDVNSAPDYPNGRIPEPVLKTLNRETKKFLEEQEKIE